MQQDTKKPYEAPVIQTIDLDESFSFGIPPAVSPMMP